MKMYMYMYGIHIKSRYCNRSLWNWSEPVYSSETINPQDKIVLWEKGGWDGAK